MGVLYALMQHDLKRLLAYHTVENIGIIFIGLGLALAFKANGMAVGGGAGAHRRRCCTSSTIRCSRACCSSAPAPCSPRPASATWSSSAASSTACRRRRSSSWSAASAISALPPLNGFVSEWLTFQAILLSPQLPSWGLKFLVPAVGALLALSAALAAACFVQGLRRHLPRPRRARRRPSARTRPTASRSPRCSCFAALCLRRRHPARACSSTRWRRSSQSLVGARMPVQTRRRLAVDRADRREPQLLQRPARVPVHR